MVLSKRVYSVLTEAGLLYGVLMQIRVLNDKAKYQYQCYLAASRLRSIQVGVVNCIRKIT